MEAITKLVEEKLTLIMGKIDRMEESQSRTALEREKLREEIKASSAAGDSRLTTIEEWG